VAGRWVEHTVTPEEAGRTVQEVLTGSLGVSRRMIQRLTRSRGIRHNRRPAYLGRKVQSGDVVAARLAGEEEAGVEPVSMELEVVHEDAEVLVVNKPPLLLVHPTSPGHTRTLSHGIAHHYLAQGVRAKVRPVHRLDRDTSGLLLVAKTAHAQHHLDRQLREGEVERRYLAFVAGVVEGEKGVVDAPIGRHQEHPQLRAVRTGTGEPAVTRYRVVERFPHATLLEVALETGRTHQIRVHLAHLGHPVLGDRHYGAQGLSLVPRQALHAWRLSFRHPATGERREFEAPLPEELAELGERLRAGAEP
jgi:23S rRNA pseudouridine1911/1915/1917 synthase